MKKLLFFVFVLCLFNSISAQQIRFSKLYDFITTGNEFGKAAFEKNGYYFILTSTWCSETDETDCIRLSKLDYSGNVIWSKIYMHGAAPNLSMTCIDERVFITRTKQGVDKQFYVYCLDLDGNVIWEKDYGLSDKPETSPIITKWGDKLVIGGYTSHLLGTQPSATIKCYVLDMEGNELGEFMVSENIYSSRITRMSEDVNGDLLITHTWCNNCLSEQYGFRLVRVDTNFTKTELLVLPHHTHNYYGQVLQYDSSTLVMLRSIFLPTEIIGKYPPAVFYMDNNANILDTVVYKNSTRKQAGHLLITEDKSVLGLGMQEIVIGTLPNGQNDTNFGPWLFKVNANREKVWERTIVDTFNIPGQGAAQHSLINCIQTSDKGYLLIGNARIVNNGQSEFHIWLVKLDSMGCLVPDCDTLQYFVDTKEAVYLNGVGLALSPNPASKSVLVELGTDVVLVGLRLLIVSADGRLVHNQVVDQHKFAVATEALPAGGYSVVVMQGNEIRQSKRLLVQRE